MSSFTPKDRFDYYWKNFALIADQRVKTFNFYVIVVGFTLAATVQALDAKKTPLLTMRLLGLGHMLCVVVFWMIEARGRAIVNIAREALREFEASEAFGDGYKPIMKEAEGGARGWWKVVTYGTAFRLVFIAHFIFGAVIAFFPSLIVPIPPAG